MLRVAVSQNGGRNWKKIATTAFGGTKTDVQCLHRWQKVIDPKLIKGCVHSTRRRAAVQPLARTAAPPLVQLCTPSLRLTH